MTVGTGILLSTILVLIYLVSVRGKWRAVGKVVGGVSLVGVVAGGGYWAWSRFEERARVVDTLAGIRLGMSPIDVKLLKGAPKQERTQPPDRDEVQRDWLFEDLVVIFTGPSADSLKVEIVCKTGGYERPLGLGEFTPEEAVIRKLGPPSNTSISSDGLRKTLSFNAYKLAFEIEKGRVNAACVTGTGVVKYGQEYQPTQQAAPIYLDENGKAMQPQRSRKSD